MQDDILTAQLFRHAVITQKPYWKYRPALFTNFEVNKPTYVCRPGQKHSPFATCAEVDVDGVPVLVCSVHPRTPMAELKDRKAKTIIHMLRTEFFGENERHAAVAQLLKHTRALGYEKIIVGGDFNSIPFSRAFRAMDSAFNLASNSVLDLLIRTTKKQVFGFSPRVDYIFYSDGLELVSASVLRESSSDHFPVCATFRISDR